MSEFAGQPLIIYVPGLKPKPEPAAHRRELFRCLLEGIRRVDPASALEMQNHDHCFDIVGWTYDFYGEYRDLNIDIDAINAVIDQASANEQDIAEAASLKRRFLRWLYAVADHFPFLMHPLADENLEVHLRDLRRYIKNENDMAEFVRRLLKMPLQAAWKLDRPVLLIGHSMGSIIAWEALWQLSQKAVSGGVDLFMTMGSPLGQRFIRRRIMGCREAPENRYPRNIGRWVNIAAVGDLTAIDMQLHDDYAEMLELGYTESIEDSQVFNYFRLDGELNVHAEYGYLVNEVTAKFIAEWWRSVRPVRDSA
jgi:pimeloyl-ACP methyl ester carboxylesterase